MQILGGHTSVYSHDLLSNWNSLGIILPEEEEVE